MIWAIGDRKVLITERSKIGFKYEIFSKDGACIGASGWFETQSEAQAAAQLYLSNLQS